jgi:hypothetical protein
LGSFFYEVYAVFLRSGEKDAKKLKKPKKTEKNKFFSPFLSFIKDKIAIFATKFSCKR